MRGNQIAALRLCHKTLYLDIEGVEQIHASINELDDLVILRKVFNDQIDNYINTWKNEKAKRSETG